MWLVSLNNLSDSSLPLVPVGKYRTEAQGEIKIGDVLLDHLMLMLMDRRRQRLIDPLVDLAFLRGGVTKTRTW